MIENRFRAFLIESQPFEGTIDKHFVDDVLIDDRLPAPKSLEEFILYLKEQESTEKVLVAAYRAWQLYCETWKHSHAWVSVDSRHGV